MRQALPFLKRLGLLDPGRKSSLQIQQLLTGQKE
jgi:hypothetical protein